MRSPSQVHMHGEVTGVPLLQVYAASDLECAHLGRTGYEHVRWILAEQLTVRILYQTDPLDLALDTEGWGLQDYSRDLGECGVDEVC